MLKGETRQRLAQLAITISDKEEQYYNFRELTAKADNSFERNIYNRRQMEISKEISTLSKEYDQLFKSGR